LNEQYYGGREGDELHSMHQVPAKVPADEVHGVGFPKKSGLEIFYLIFLVASTRFKMCTEQ
jgi:hypothetical protein